MHLVERYALGCGVKIDKPFIYDKYFPLAIDKFITIHTTSKDAKTYDYWQEVVDILRPILAKKDIGILQIGAKDERPLHGCYLTLGQTSINQTAYLVKRGLLHLGVDSFPVHMAGYFDKPIVALYSNNFVNVVKPYWGDEQKQILIEPDRQGKKPSFSLTERPKSINTIKPETIAQSVCSLLDIPFDYDYETVFIGETFSHIVVENVPNQNINIRDFGIDSIVMRMDFLFDEQMLIKQLSQCPCTIVTRQAINPNILAQFKPNIVEIHYEITPEHDPKFAQAMLQLGMKYNLYSFMTESELDKIKFDYMDLGIIYPQSSSMPDELQKENLNELFYKSTKFTLSQGKIYPSKYAWQNNQVIPNIGNFTTPITELKNINNLWLEKRHLRIVKKKPICPKN